MCICGSEREFQNCCQPIIERRAEPKSALELMRSRYSAYVKGEAEYLLYSTAQENRFADDLELIKEFANSVEWLKLDIIQSSFNTVEFKAYYRDKEGIKVLHEKSNFVEEDGIWKYRDGTLYNSHPQRNEPCPCQSGKKFKKCCMR